MDQTHYFARQRDKSAKFLKQFNNPRFQNTSKFVDL